MLRVLVLLPFLILSTLSSAHAQFFSADLGGDWDFYAVYAQNDEQVFNYDLGDLFINSDGSLQQSVIFSIGNEVLDNYDITGGRLEVTGDGVITGRISSTSQDLRVIDGQMDASKNFFTFEAVGLSQGGFYSCYALRSSTRTGFPAGTYSFRGGVRAFDAGASTSTTLTINNLGNITSGSVINALTTDSLTQVVNGFLDVNSSNFIDFSFTTDINLLVEEFFGTYSSNDFGAVVQIFNDTFFNFSLLYSDEAISQGSLAGIWSVGGFQGDGSVSGFTGQIELNSAGDIINLNGGDIESGSISTSSQSQVRWTYRNGESCSAITPLSVNSPGTFTSIAFACSNDENGYLTLSKYDESLGSTRQGTTMQIVEADQEPVFSPDPAADGGDDDDNGGSSGCMLNTQTSPGHALLLQIVLCIGLIALRRKA
jgi:hypothetical protein